MSQDPWRQPDDKGPRLGLYLWVGALVGIGLLVFLLLRAFPEESLSNPDVIQTVAVLALVSSSLLFVRHFNVKQTVRNILLWLGVGAVLVLGFSYQEELMGIGQRLRADLIPGTPLQTSAGEMVISASEGGGFHANGTVNGTPVRFLVDTGASSIVLSPADAKKLGIDLDNLVFNRAYETANGIGYGASATVDELTVGHIRLTNVPVSINQAPMRNSLLGMTFLNRMKSFNISGRKLVLRY
ncbi:MAG: TIGR02281 family clan AA aspartic protease [Pseudomonadota bacterium]